MSNINNGERVTGSSDEHYDLISVLYHSLEGAATYEIYIQDAEERGDSELSEFLQEIQEQECQRAERAKEMLARRLAQPALR
ncbi:MAG: hypothetical protein LDL41_06725 [Coleofasciculus sp. S288]|nr:hypothetical protein [Coleofasciculus sp. S288]